MKFPYRFSPLPIEAYIVTVHPDYPESALMLLPEAEAGAIWNLLYLSTPSLDKLGSTDLYQGWESNYKVPSGAIEAVIADVLADEALYRKLRMEPRDFVRFFAREDHSCYRTEAVYGPEWAKVVINRALQSAQRLDDLVERSSARFTGYVDTFYDNSI